MIQLRWKASFSASCLHAAACMQEGLPIADSEICAVLQPAADALVSELNECGFEIEPTLSILTCLAADFENNRQLVERAAAKLKGSQALGETSLARLAGCASDLEAAWLRVAPNLVDELAVRGRPIREQWEARGPGLLRAVSKLAGEGVVASAAEVVLVSPVVGGHGRAHLQSNRVTFEAVLTNPDPAIPEVVRLGWLLAQLNLDVPMLSESVAQQKLPRLASLATMPLILQAAETVELGTLDETSLARAMQVWHVPSPSETTARTLLDWWQAFRVGRTRWPVGLAALDEMLEA